MMNRKFWEKGFLEEGRASPRTPEMGTDLGVFHN